MKIGNSGGPYGISIEVQKCLRDQGIAWLPSLFNKILKFKRCMMNEKRVISTNL